MGHICDPDNPAACIKGSSYCPVWESIIGAPHRQPHEIPFNPLPRGDGYPEEPRKLRDIRLQDLLDADTSEWDDPTGDLATGGELEFVYINGSWLAFPKEPVA